MKHPLPDKFVIKKKIERSIRARYKRPNLIPPPADAFDVSCSVCGSVAGKPCRGLRISYTHAERAALAHVVEREKMVQEIQHAVRSKLQKFVGKAYTEEIHNEMIKAVNSV